MPTESGPRSHVSLAKRRQPRTPSLLQCLYLLVALVCVPAVAEEFKQPEPLEPQIAEASDEAQGAMATIRIPEGWDIRLFAAEPDVANVVAFDVDHRGRVFACESFRQNRGVTDNRSHDNNWLMADLKAQTVQDRIDYHKALLGEAAVTYAQHDDRIRRLDDSDGDGVADKSYVVANGFNRLEEGTGAGILVRGSDIYFTNIPKLWRLVDADDNGDAEQRNVLSDGYGVRVAFRGHDLHGLVIGPDGRLYFSIGDRGYHITTAEGKILANPESGAVFRCELDGSNLEVFATGLRNPQELAFNDVGDLFSVDNNSDSGDKARVVHILEGGDTGWRMHYQYLPDRGPFNREKIWEPFHEEQPAYIVPPIANLTDGPSGLAYYPGTGFGDALQDQFLICDFRGGPANSGIRSFKLDSDGAFYKLGEHAEPIWTVLATDIAFSPDGAIYISDWVDGWEGIGKGRIYRLTDPKHHGSAIVKEVQQRLQSDWSTRSVEDLAADLSHQDRRVRFEAQWELARRKLASELVAVAVDKEQTNVARMHAVWGADQVARQEESSRSDVLAGLRPLLTDSDDVIRAAVAKVAGERGDGEAVSQLVGLLADSSARVQYMALMSMSKLKSADGFPKAVEIAAANGNQDPALRHAVATYFASLPNASDIAGLSSHPDAHVRRVAVVALRRGRSSEIAKFLGDSEANVVAEAVRAIHDEAIPVASRALANLIDGETKDAEVIRRVLNANYRIGGAAEATKLAAFTTKFSAPVEMRLEALDMLGTWANPAPLDRVLGSYRPLEPRKAKDAADALSPQIENLMSAEEKVREKTIEVAAALGLKKIIPLLVDRIDDEKQRPALRATALRSLLRLDRDQAYAKAKKVPLAPATSLVSASLEVLADVDARGAIDTFIKATESRDTKVRQLAWDILAKADDPKSVAQIKSGLELYLKGELAKDAELNVIEAVAALKDEQLQARVDAHIAKLKEGDALGPWLASLEGGDVDNGRTIFHQRTELSCLRCHKVDRGGGEVGPNLTVIGKQRDRRYLLEAICLPNAKIAEGFETAMILDFDGQMTTGIVKSEDDEFIELVEASGSLTRIAIDDIDLRRKGKSSMPEDLITKMSARDLRDLVAYLASLQVDPRDEEDIE